MLSRKIFNLTMSCIAVGIGVRATEISPDPIIHYRLDENSGSTLVADTAAGRHDARIIVAQPQFQSEFVPGQHGNAVKFRADAPMRFVIPENSVLKALKPPFTIAFWANPSHGYKNLWVFGNNDGGISVRIFYQMFDFRWTDQNGVPHILQTPKFSAAMNAMQHYAVVNDGQRIMLYINGEPQELSLHIRGAKIDSFHGREYTGDAAELIPANTAGDYAIGGYYYNFAYPFEGIIDDLCVFNRALSSDELVTVAAESCNP